MLTDHQIKSELRLMFYLKNGLGFYPLYSPNLDTIRALLTPQTGTIGMFGPNHSINLSTRAETGTGREKV